MLVIGWAVTLASIAGVVLNIKHRRECFYIWACTNAFWAVLDFTQGIYSQAALQATYVGLAVYGIIEWRKGR